MKMRFTVCIALALAYATAPLYSEPAPSPAAAGQNAGAPVRPKTADEAWASIEKLSKGPEKRPESKEEVITYLKQLQSALADFIARFPGDPRRFEAKLTKLGIESSALASLTGTPADPKAIEAVCKEILAEKELPAKVRRGARFFLLLNALEQGVNEKLQSEVAAFRKDYPKEPGGDVLNFTLAKKLVASAPAKAEALLAEVAKSDNEQVAQSAQAELRLLKLRGKPLDLKFKAVDGSQVDLAKLRGKVVLVDFWATWCAPCMMEAPHVVEAYQKLHGKGFEIIGISLDQQKEAMLKATKELGMTWPQYFDGKGWENELSSKYGIETIPAMWLVDKKGILVNTDAGENLEAAVEKLLAE